MLVVILADEDDQRLLMRSVAAGADGFVLTSMPLDAVLDAVRDVAKGNAFVPAGMLGGLLRGMIDDRRRRQQAGRRTLMLTGREQEVLSLLAAGAETTAIADRLGRHVKRCARTSPTCSPSSARAAGPRPQRWRPSSA